MSPNDLNMSRSHFLRNGLRSAFQYTSEAVRNSMEKTVDKAVIPMLRPPGAVNEMQFLLQCTRCDDCIEACPENAILKADAKHGAAIGTPYIEPDTVACVMCEDFPCIAACEPKALTTEMPMKIGTAVVAKTKCFAYQGQICDYCYDRCPDKGNAILMENGKPRVVDDICTGCGLCEYFCPAPGNGIKILPDRQKAS